MPGAIFDAVDGVDPHYDIELAGHYLPGDATGGEATAVFFDLDPTTTGYTAHFTSGAFEGDLIGFAAYADTLAIVDTTAP